MVFSAISFEADDDTDNSVSAGQEKTKKTTCFILPY